MLNQVKVNNKPSAWLPACLLLGVITAVFVPCVSKAQDRILKTDNTVIEAKVIEVSTNDIKYKKFSNPSGPTYVVLKQDVSSITYENGEKEMYGQLIARTALPAGTREYARSLVLAGNVNEAIAAYALLLARDKTNPVLLAEDAYVLALGGIYDAALLRLDMSWQYPTDSKDVSYYSAQVFALMGDDDLAREFWRASEKNSPPSWIAPSATALNQKFGNKHPGNVIKNRDQLIAAFKRANELASQNSYFQSIALFHDITDLYPNEYLPYVGYSIALEKTRAYAKSVQTVEKAISLIGNSPQEKPSKHMLEQRLATVKLYLTSPPPMAPPGIQQSSRKEPEKLQMMAYAGGVVSKDFTSLNGRIGYFVTGSTNASLDLGLIKTPETSSTNVGLTVYNNSRNFVSGAGFMLNAASGSTSFAVKFSVGYSKMNRSRSSSFDIFLDFNRGLQTNGLTTYIFSIGKSFYFGKRK